MTDKFTRFAKKVDGSRIMIVDPRRPNEPLPCCEDLEDVCQDVEDKVTCWLVHPTIGICPYLYDRMYDQEKV